VTYSETKEKQAVVPTAPACTELFRMRFFKDEDGQTLVLVAACIALLLGFTALAVDVGLLFRSKRNLQIAADAGAINAAAELSQGDWAVAGKTATAQNGFTDGVGAVTITVHNPPQYGAFKNVANKNAYAEVIATMSQPVFFMRVFHIDSMNITARAVARSVPGTTCVYALQSSPPGGVGLSLSSTNAVLSASGCGIVVNATGAKSVSVSGGASLSAGSLSVAGSAVSVSGTSSLTLSNPSTPTTNMTSVSDPLASVTPPTKPSTCLNDPKINNQPSTVTLGGSGGTVCYNGLTISNSTVSLSPGVYYINGNLNIGSSSSISGTGVTFYVTNGGSISIQGGATVNLSAPTTAPYAGMLIYQDRSDTSTASLSGGSSGSINGIIYVPNALLKLAGSSNTTFNVDLVTGSMQVTGGATLNPYAPLDGASLLSSPRLAE
jgi:Flp pilus assembly protein TadG